MLKLPAWLTTALIVLVAVVWLGSFVVGIFVAGYEPPPSVSLLFSAVMTTLIIDKARAPAPAEPEPQVKHPTAKKRR